MLPWSIEFRGRFDEIVFESEVLKGNRLGDPHQRPLWVYLPPGYDDEPGRRYSTIYLIQGLTGQLDMWRNRPPLRKNFPELADELFAKGEAPPCILVWVDCWTSLGGSQFLDSPATGRYHTYKRLSSSARAGAAAESASAASSTANSEVACLIAGPPLPGRPTKQDQPRRTRRLGKATAIHGVGCSAQAPEGSHDRAPETSGVGLPVKRSWRKCVRRIPWRWSKPLRRHPGLRARVTETRGDMYEYGQNRRQAGCHAPLRRYAARSIYGTRRASYFSRGPCWLGAGSRPGSR
jgi:hypothetical protein